MKAFLFAAGFGKRMEALTKDNPKPLLPVGNIPLLAYSLFTLYLWKVEAAIINLHYYTQKIQDYLSDFPHFPLYFSCEKEILETAGGLRYAMEMFPSHLSCQEPIILLNSDVILMPASEDTPKPSLLENGDTCLFLAPADRTQNLTYFSFVSSKKKEQTCHTAKKLFSPAPNSNEERYYYIGYAVQSLKSIASLRAGDFVKLRKVWERSSQCGRLYGKLFRGNFWEAGDALAYENANRQASRMIDREFLKEKWSEFTNAWPVAIYKK